jgi:hypothetical protein
MKKLIGSMIMIGLISVSVLAEDTVWIRVAGTQKMDVYVDFSRMRRADKNTLEVWTKLKPLTQESSTGKPIDHVIAYMESDCRHNRNRIIFVTNHLKNGEIISNDFDEQLHVIPEPSVKSILKTVCLYADMYIRKDVNE